jgi:hypothetical protein
MNWEAIGALSELFGAGGVIVTLAFLARQIQQNTRAVRASTNHALTEQRNDLNLRFGLDPSAAELVLRGARSRKDLDFHERYRHSLLMRAVLGISEDTYVQYREGMCDSETWELHKVVLRPIITSPDFSAWWERDREIFRAGFRSEVDAMLRAA